MCAVYLLDFAWAFLLFHIIVILLSFLSFKTCFYQLVNEWSDMSMSRPWKKTQLDSCCSICLHFSLLSQPFSLRIFFSRFSTCPKSISSTHLIQLVFFDFSLLASLFISATIFHTDSYHRRRNHFDLLSQNTSWQWLLAKRNEMEKEKQTKRQNKKNSKLIHKNAPNAPWERVVTVFNKTTIEIQSMCVVTHSVKMRKKLISSDTKSNPFSKLHVLSNRAFYHSNDFHMKNPTLNGCNL